LHCSSSNAKASETLCRQFLSICLQSALKNILKQRGHDRRNKLSFSLLYWSPSRSFPLFSRLQISSLFRMLRWSRSNARSGSSHAILGTSRIHIYFIQYRYFRLV
jgi:hypothetical protein